MEKPPSPENNENLETKIEELLGKLRAEYFPEDYDEDAQQEMYEIEMEAEVGKNRNQALERLRYFLEKISKLPRKET